LKPAEDYLQRFPHQLSGGQRQRVVIAGALVLEPHLLLADEPVSMLDVSIRAEIINLLADLRKSRGISVIFITHDLGTVGYFADRVAVMYLGRIVELGEMGDVLKNPQHPYTKALLSVIPVPNPRQRKKRIILQGETPNPIDLPIWMPFPSALPRCTAEVQRAGSAAVFRKRDASGRLFVVDEIGYTVFNGKTIFHHTGLHWACRSDTTLAPHCVRGSAGEVTKEKRLSSKPLSPFVFRLFPAQYGSLKQLKRI
jgi:oligopeptide/dipeptide ABC transporter ATP-binding protein